MSETAEPVPARVVAGPYLTFSLQGNKRQSGDDVYHLVEATLGATRFLRALGGNNRVFTIKQA